MVERASAVDIDPNEGDWEWYRPELERLWSSENKTLREVKSYMETKHKFFAKYVLPGSLLHPVD
jgi:hypothetical protein